MLGSTIVFDIQWVVVVDGLDGSFSDIFSLSGNKMGSVFIEVIVKKKSSGDRPHLIHLYL